MYFDPWADDWQSLSWVAESFVRTLEDVKDDTKYQTPADLRPTDLATIDRFHKIKRRGTGDYDDGVARVLLYEVVDIRNRQVITYADGGESPLRVVPYKLADVMPNGPYIFSTYMDDLEENVGIASPDTWQHQQMVLTVLATVQVLVAKAQVPGMGIKKGTLSQEEIDAYKENIINRLVQFENMEDGQSIRDVIEQLPMPQSESGTAAVTGWMIELIEKLSGLGHVKLGGGDRSRTATASALVSESVDAMLRMAAVTTDRSINTAARYTARIQRKLYTRAKVVSIAGDEAIAEWPVDGFPLTYIRDDRSIGIVVGTMRRESNEVELKLASDLYGSVAIDPLVPVPARLKLLNHIFRLSRMPIDLSPEIRAVEETPVPATPAGTGGPEPGNGDPRLAGLLQGRQNVGGGRL
jgi:hypothetical protein